MRLSRRISCSILAFLALVGLAGCDGGGSGKSNDPPPAPELAYPETAAGADSDTYFNRKVADPYRWLEDIRSQKVDNWIQAQNRFTADYIAALPDYQAIARRIQAWYGSPEQVAVRRAKGLLQVETTRRVQGEQGADGRYYYQIQVERERQRQRYAPQAPAQFVSADNIIYVSSSAKATDQGKVLVNVNDFRTDPDDNIRLIKHKLSADGKYLVYLMERNFADVADIHVVDMTNPGRPALTLVIPNVYSGEFALTEDGVVYTLPRDTQDPHVSPHTFQALYYRPFDGGSAELWYEAGEFDMITPVALIEGLFYFSAAADFNAAMLRLDPAHPEAGAESILDARADGKSFFLTGESSENPGKFLFTTTQGTALSRLIEVDPADPAPENWREILPRSAPGEKAYVNTIVSCGAHYYAEHLDLGSSRLFHYSAGEKREIPLPGMGAVKDMQCSETLQGGLDYAFSTLSQPKTSYSYDPAAQEAVKGPEEQFEGYDPGLYEMRRLMATSPDGTRIPVYIAHKKGLKASGDAPVMIYTYGGFAVPVMPGFQSKVIPLLESGGIYAVAQVRGGAEFGLDWHDGGRLLNKQNTYDDVVAVAEHLIGEGLTRPGKIGLQGESNGGLTTAAVGLQRPDLFGVVFPMVGVLDLVRYSNFSSGFAWHGDYGRTTDQAEFENLMKFSPLHNVKPIAYAPTYVFTGKSDGRVMPAHSYKYAAALQNTATGTNPYLLYAFPKDGHNLELHRQTMLTYMWTAFFHHTGSRFSGPMN